MIVTGKKQLFAVGLLVLTLGAACGGSADAPDGGPAEAPRAALTLPSSPELVQNGGFDRGLDGWVSYFMNGGDAQVAVKRGEAVISVLAPGSDYSAIQFHTGPGFALTAGKSYRLSFRARASGNTTIGTSIWENGHDTDGNGFAWSTYRFTYHQLTTDMTTYTVDFVMPLTNPDAGLCFFLGGVTGKVFLDDVSLVELIPPPLGTQLITNGGFDRGIKQWVPYLMNGGAARFSGKNGEAVVNVTRPATDYSGIQFHTGVGIPLFAGKSYRLTFRARATGDATIGTSIWENGHDLDGNGFAWSTYQFTYHHLTAEMTTYSVDFVMPTTNADAGLCFFLGDVSGTVVLDDVSLEEVAPPPPNPELIANGGFDGSLDGWVPFLMNGGDAQFAAVNGEAALTVVAPATDFSGIQFHTGPGFALEAGKSYRLSFLARADSYATLETSVWENGHDLDGDGFAWSTYQFNYHQLTPTMTAYTVDFTMPLTNADAGLCFFLGDVTGTVYLDGVSLVAL